MSILVTGGTGYIGSHTVVELIEQGNDVVIVDNLVNSSVIVLDRIEQITGKRPKFYEVDVCHYDELNAVFEKENISAVIHFAAHKAVGESVQKPTLYYRNNLDGLVTLIDVMKAHDVKKIVFSSSATVYGSTNEAPYLESMPISSAMSPYGNTKVMCEQILKDVHASDNDWEVTLLRYFNPIGAHESGLIGEDPTGIPNNLMPFIAQVAVGKLKQLSVFGDDYPTPDGTCERDYIHVVDLAKGHVKALNYIKAGVSIYNLGSGVGTSVLELVRAFEKVSDVKINYTIAPRRAGDLAVIYANTDLAFKELGFKTEKTIEDMCQDTWRWQSQNPQGFR
ncbi:UDP-glucose 4-epimerase GalE [Carnobacteriaceae bacterium zg-ZUI252]|nr:UDP-glucose 4-epimerase GalE [Carnobacteriaceae bacterium zg-ZUI252]QTU82683.1 UDP-glucose 4-epimerase GalE [Carnobacteriaceae bacterium zg-C25]